MAITRLTDIITVFDSKWTYGDVKFGYDGEVNQDHDTQYPLMLVTPPESIIPAIYDGREEYSFEINFYNLYSQAAQSAVTLQNRWDNLQDLSYEWLDMVLKNYQDVTVEAYLNDESIEIERIKDTKNDKLVQIKLVFTMSAFTKCFRPVSNYPSDFADLNVWIRADSSVTFSIPTKKVILIGDGSGNGNGVSKEPSMGQPLRYTYGGGVLDKTMLTFTNDILVSDNNLKTSLANEQFSVFEVSKINAVSNALFGYYHLTDGSLIEMGTNAAGNYEVSVSDGTTTLSEKTATIDTGKFHIASLRKDGATIYLNYYDSGNTFYASDYDGSFDLTKSFEQSKFTVGCVKASNGLIPPSETNARYLDGDFQEVIIYDRKLTDDETAKVVDYLNKKYKIY